MDDKINDGGPAFPTSAENYERTYSDTGLSLRDYFAAKAVLASEFEYLTDEDRARRAYQLADAMLAARSR
jgi:hypothetical protein